MAEKQCSDCKMMIDAEAKVCPHCRKKVKKPISKTAAAVVIGITVFIIIALSNKEPEPTGDGLGAYRYACKEFLLKTLNDPGSAQLEDYSVWHAVRQADGSIRVQPTGRAKNAFGAYVLGTWDCVVRDDGTNRRLVSMKQIGR